jgi:hypothetical protein
MKSIVHRPDFRQAKNPEPEDRESERNREPGVDPAPDQSKVDTTDQETNRNTTLRRTIFFFDIGGGGGGNNAYWC